MEDVWLRDRIARRAGQWDVPAVGSFDVRRARSVGPLTREEIAYCRENRIALAYDPVQIGWVAADCIDDIDVAGVRAPIIPVAARFSPRGLAPTYRFRAWTEADLPVYRSLLDDAAVWAMMYEPYPDPLDDALARELIRLSGNDHHEVRAVLRNGEIVGQVRVLFGQGAEQRNAEISYWVGRAYWGQGIASAVVAIQTGQTFQRDPALTSITAVAHADNRASRRVLQKAGYAEDGPDTRRPGWIVYRQTRAGAMAINSGSDPT